MSAVFGACGPQNDAVTSTTDTAANAETQAAIESRERVLYVWAGDQAHVAADFVAVVDFDEDSPHYGRIIRTVPLPGPGSVGNEPHHVGLSKDGNVLALGGLLSVLRGQPDINFFDVRRPRHPVFIKSADPPNSAIADEFDALNGGGFMVTMMGGAGGAAPGRLAEFDGHLNLVAEWPAVLPTDGGFDPHGLAIREEENLMINSDFICPAHTLHIPGGDQAIFRGSVRVWDFAARTIVRTIQVGDPNAPAGTIDARLIPHDPHLRGFTAGMADNQLYLIDTTNGLATAVFDFSIYADPNTTAPIWPSLIRINNAGTRLFITLNYVGQAGRVVMFDISNPNHPHVLDVQNLGAGSGPHYLRLTSDEKRLVVSDYFLVEDLAPGGIVQAEGDHKVHVFKVKANRLEHDNRFDLDFNRDIATGPARPHGVVMNRAHDRDDD